MKNNCFKLISIYEYIVDIRLTTVPLRIEVFQKIDESNIYRARIWTQNTYNLYPTQLNTGKNGEDLHAMHSCDQLDMEITSIIAEDASLITGKKYTNEEDFVKYITSRTDWYIDTLNK